MTRRAWLAASVAACVLSVLIAASGGAATTVGGVRISARSWLPSATMSALALAAWWWSAARPGVRRDDLHAVHGVFETRGRALALLFGLLAVVTTLAWATYSASGADASGYLSQAAMWSRPAARVSDPLVLLPEWPVAAGDTAPLGWRPAREPGWQVPTYAPGLPWLMAIPHALAGTSGAVLVIALAAGLAVWATGMLAWQLGGGLAAVLASLLVATSPTFLYQAFQPMSDVPVTAAWVVCWWLVSRGAPAGAGVAAALAVLVRPNLAPLAAAPFLVVLLCGRPVPARRDALRLAAPVALAGIAIALVQWRWYGSPLTSGYGSAAELFTVANLAPNTRLYAGWLWQAERTFVIASALAITCALWSWVQTRLAREPGESWQEGRGAALVTAGPGRRHVAAGLLIFAAGVGLAYLVYAVFEVWSYVRFLLPAIAVTAALSGAAIARGVRALPRHWRGVAALVLLLAAVATGLRTARSLGVFQIADLNSRTRVVGDALATILPPRAVLLAGEQSGSMRYATGRPILRWEPLDAASLRAAVSVLEAQGFEAWWVLDQWEEGLVRSRFADVPAAQLDWPPRVEGGPLMRTRAWRLADRP